MPPKQPAFKIIVVDDDDLDRYVIDRSFKAIGDSIELIQVTDPTRAVETIRAQKPDVTLLDVQMPGMNGFDILHALAQNQDKDDAPVLVLSSSSREDDRERALKLGASDYLIKPSTLEGYQELANAVHADYLVNCH